MLLGWYGAKRQHVEKYLDIYQEFGFQPLVYIAPTDSVTFNFIRLKSISESIFNDIKQAMIAIESNMSNNTSNMNDNQLDIVTDNKNNEDKNSNMNDNNSTNAKIDEKKERNDNPNEKKDNKQEKENTNFKIPLFIHVFSNGGGLPFGCMNTLLSNDKYKLEYGKYIEYSGVIFDSCPGPILTRGNLAVWITFWHFLDGLFCCLNKYSKRNCLIKSFILFIKILIMIIFLLLWIPLFILFILYGLSTFQVGIVFSYYDKLIGNCNNSKYNNNNNNNSSTHNKNVLKRVSSLHITSEKGVDYFCPNSATCEIIELRKKICESIDVSCVESLPELNHELKLNDSILIVKHVFSESGHVQHYRQHKEEYSQLVQKFVKYCLFQKHSSS